MKLKRLGHTLKRRAFDVLVCFARPGNLERADGINQEPADQERAIRASVTPTYLWNTPCSDRAGSCGLEQGLWGGCGRFSSSHQQNGPLRQVRLMKRINRVFEASTSEGPRNDARPLRRSSGSSR